MLFLHNALAASFPALNLFQRFGNFTGFKSSQRLRVLLYHDIAPEEHEDFERQLGWLSHRWTFISPEQFASFIKGDIFNVTLFILSPVFLVFPHPLI